MHKLLLNSLTAALIAISGMALSACEEAEEVEVEEGAGEGAGGEVERD